MSEPNDDEGKYDENVFCLPPDEYEEEDEGDEEEEDDEAQMPSSDDGAPVPSSDDGAQVPSSDDGAQVPSSTRANSSTIHDVKGMKRHRRVL